MNEKINKVIKNTEIKRKTLFNCTKSFIVGGLICEIGQISIDLFKMYFNVNEQMSYTLSSMFLIFIGVALTSFGIYDRIGQFAGAGTIVPITGFANSCCSSAIEYKSEGLVLGIIPNVLKLAGSVIVVAVVSSFIFGSLIYLWEVLF